MNPILPFTALARVLHRTGFVLLLALCAGSCTTNDVPTPDPTNADSLIRFDIAPCPGFGEVDTDGSPALSGGTSADRPSTRITQTPEAAQWEDGDILWIRTDFYNAAKELRTTYITALKRDGGHWRSLTDQEEEDHIAPCVAVRRFYKKEIRWPNELYGIPDTYCQIYARYLGQQYPDADGKIAVTPDIDVINISNYYSTFYPGEVAELRFYQPLTRLRITKACQLQFKSWNYTFLLPGFNEESGAYALNDLQVPPGGEDYFFNPEYNYNISINGQKIQLLPDAQGSFKGMSYTIDPERLPSGPVVPEF